MFFYKDIIAIPGLCLGFILSQNVYHRLTKPYQMKLSCVIAKRVDKVSKVLKKIFWFFFVNLYKPRLRDDIPFYSNYLVWWSIEYLGVSRLHFRCWQTVLIFATFIDSSKKCYYLCCRLRFRTCVLVSFLNFLNQFLF